MHDALKHRCYLPLTDLCLTVGKTTTIWAREASLPSDSPRLQNELRDCMPSLVIERALAPSGQRVVYLARFDDSLIPEDMRRAAEAEAKAKAEAKAEAEADVEAPDIDDPDDRPFLWGWESWGNIVVKVVSGADTNTIARLQAEVDILAAVRPANFPKLLYANLFKNNPVTDEPLAERLYVTIEEFIDGHPLEDIWRQFLGDEMRIARLALGIANALMPLWVHPQRYVHRDIKPPNILIRPNGDVVVIDLGVVRETGAKGLTQTGFVAPLTPGYAAPEQFRDERALICFKTDFFAIGVVMYLLMSGNHPFHWDGNMDRLDVQLATLNHDPKPLSELVQVSQQFSDFVEKAMKKAQFERQRTPDIFVEQLEALLGLSKN